MSSMEVDVDALRSMASSLARAGSAVGGTGGSAPTGVDAGDMTGVVTGIAAALTEAAAGLAEGLHAASTGVHDSLSTYASSDTAASQRFQRGGVPQ